MREKSQENAALQLKLLEISREIEAAKEGQRLLLQPLKILYRSTSEVYSMS